MSWTEWTGGDWFAKLLPQWPTPDALRPEAVAESMARLVDVFGFSPAGFLTNLVSGASATLVGREITTTVGSQEVHFVLDALRVDPPRYGPVIGQFGAIEIEVRDVGWADRRIDHLCVRAGNVHLQPGATTDLVAAPVSLSALLSQRELGARVERASSRVVIELAGGVATAALAGYEHWGHLEVAMEVRGDVVRLRPVAMTLRQRRLHALTRLIPQVTLPLPEAPRNGRFTGIAVEGDQLRVDMEISEWREPLEPNQLRDLDRRLHRAPHERFRLMRTKPGIPTQPGSPEAKR